eukprot:CAMPEP_0201502190 /NCGR_PEP_ID=MMETSP0151_2-20130828/84002_1 /ASSEMBLY_ACC=CAM_ASM_000257 /TAXON_ID=200890 /ORGANISM="Paramoeba atlantica, Strain 621/1 / CCAP 1560/9" /LENGTH=386 /DNA_ID=CAMNT_0047895767 /DNA_START=85 /DNA_END=1242 /DNA_ORIENTATION=+
MEELNFKWGEPQKEIKREEEPQKDLSLETQVKIQQILPCKKVGSGVEQEEAEKMWNTYSETRTVVMFTSHKRLYSTQVRPHFKPIVVRTKVMTKKGVERLLKDLSCRFPCSIHSSQFPKLISEMATIHSPLKACQQKEVVHLFSKDFFNSLVDAVFLASTKVSLSRSLEHLLSPCLVEMERYLNELGKNDDKRGSSPHPAPSLGCDNQRFFGNCLSKRSPQLFSRGELIPKKVQKDQYNELRTKALQIFKTKFPLELRFFSLSFLLDLSCLRNESLSITSVRTLLFREGSMDQEGVTFETFTRLFPSASKDFLVPQRIKPSEQNTDPAEQLPEDLFVQILCFLPPHSLAACSLVSKQWNELTHDPIPWKNMFIARFKSKEPSVLGW